MCDGVLRANTISGLNPEDWICHAVTLTCAVYSNAARIYDVPRSTTFLAALAALSRFAGELFFWLCSPFSLRDGEKQHPGDHVCAYRYMYIL